jgi:N-hydroxyarylamine O-acetyltransferase
VPRVFDLDAYLKRIGYEGPRTPTMATLEAIHALQPAAIPFEGLDPFLRRPVPLDLASLQAKLVRQRRGGYCFELNTLFGGALEALAFTVTHLAGRVRWMAPPDRPHSPRTHHLLRVDLEEGTYLADVGFGGHLLAGPIRLQREIEQSTPASVVRLAGADQTYMLQALLPKGWQDMYLFTLEPQHPIDYEVANWFTSTNPGSRFHAALLAERLTPERRLSLFNTKLTERRPGAAASERILANAEELSEVFDRDFGVTLPVDPADVWEKIPKS